MIILQGNNSKDVGIPQGFGSKEIDETLASVVVDLFLLWFQGLVQSFL